MMMMSIRKIICIALGLALSAGTGAQELVDDYQPENYTNYFRYKTITMEAALDFLSEVYQVNFIFEHELIDQKASPVLPEVSGNFYDDLVYALGNNPIQFIKAGKKTIVLIARPKMIAVRRIIRGRVSDSKGYGIPDAEVYIPGTSWGAVTDVDGSYVIESVPEGNYTLTANCVGYRTEWRDLQIRSSLNEDVNFVLTIDVLNMDEVVTTASRNPLTKIESSVAISTANSAQIRQRKSRSTADLLKFIPGFYVESSGGESGNNLFPRGIPQDGSFRYVAMFEDGLPVFEAPELAFANIDILLRVDENISQLEGVRGGTGSIYASNAPGGIINFTNKTGGEHTEGVVKLTAGDYGHYRLDYNLNGPLGERWRYSAGGFMRRGDGIRNPGFVANQGGQLKVNLTRLFNNGYARLYARYLNDRNVFYLPIPLQDPENPRSIPGVDANYGTLTSRFAGPAMLPRPDGTNIRSDIRDGIHPELFSTTAEWFVDLGKNWSVNFKTRWTSADVRFNAIFSLDTPFTAGEFADSVKQLSGITDFAYWQYSYADSQEPVRDISALNNNGLVARSGWWSIEKPMKNLINQLQLRKEFEQHSLDITAYHSNYKADDFWYFQNVLTEIAEQPRMLDLTAFDANGNELLAVTDNGFEQYGSFYVNAESRASVLALALVDEWQISNRLRLDAAVRLEQNRFSGRVENTRSDAVIPNRTSLAAQNVTHGIGTFRHFNHTFNEAAFSLGANYGLSRDLAFYGRAGRGFRTPDFEQWIVSEEKGHSQYVQQIEGGIKLATERFSLFGSAFYSRLDNIPFIDEVFRNNRLVKLGRFASSTTLGMEIEGMLNVFTPLDLYFSTTLQDPALRGLRLQSVDEATSENQVVDLDGKQVRRIPKVLLNLRPSLKLKPVQLFVEWQYISRRFADDANTAVLPAYALLNAGFEAPLPGTKITFSGNVANITNTIGLTEGNPRVEQVFANRNNDVFMARPILGRSILLSAVYDF